MIRSHAKTRIQPWFITLAGSIAATIGTILHAQISADGSLTLAQAAEFATAHWRAFPVPWLTFYGMSILLLNGIAVFILSRDVPHLRSAGEWAVDFCYRFGITQYFTCLILLLALAIAGFSFEFEYLPNDQTWVETALRFTPCVGLALAGLVIWSICSAIVLARVPVTTVAPASTSDGRLSDERLAAELERLAGVVEHQRPLAEGTSARIAALSEAVQAIYQDVKLLLNRQTSPISDDLSQAQAALDRSASDLRMTVGSLQDSLRQLGQVSGALVPADPSPRPSISRSELSHELKKLLEQLPPR